MLARAKTIMIAFSTAIGLSSIAMPASSDPPKGFELYDRRYLVPQTAFRDEHSMNTSIAAFKGKIVIMNFWATWCAPCIKEMPSLERLATRLPTDKFAVIAINQDKGGMPVAKAFVERLGIDRMPIYADPANRLSRDLGIRGLPTTVIIRRDGTLLGKLEGVSEWDEQGIVSYLMTLSEM